MRTRIVVLAALLMAGCSGAGGPGPSSTSTSQPVHPAAALLGPGLVPPPLTAPEDLGGLPPDPAAATLGEDLLPPS